MPCFKPLEGYLSATKNPSGKRSVLFTTKGALLDRKVKVPCGQCIGCRLERSRQWAVRCVHEASLYKSNCFITLTYSDEHLPSDRSLDVSHFQKFMKRLRKKYGKNIRFFHCGEYGEQLGRPHYHACIFGFDFPDKVLWKTTSQGLNLYVSDSLNKLWGNGYATIGDVTFESAAYVARYVLKKVTGDAAASHYQVIDFETGEISCLKPEYVTMSRRPGIGRGWYDKYGTDVHPSDVMVIRGGVKVRAPRYYDGLYEVIDPNGMDKIRAKRCREGKKYVDNSTPERLDVREQCLEAKLTKLKRNLK